MVARCREEPDLGAFALRNDMADVWLTMLFGFLGFFMRRWALPVPPLVMGVITRPISAALLALSVLIVAWPLVRSLRRRRFAPA